MNMSSLFNNQNNQMINEFKTYQKDPFKFLMNKKFNIPQNISQNPEAIANYLVSSGQMPKNTFNQLKGILGL